ncbi:delta-9 fatty acid desaturase [Stachybotrys elegans]|uniref:Acyl-CoA desaturase n=1 Tax=Stachybotrys elegans TaxID=80388 RepID=A0A8K0SQX6_9HYPO|nr:delta-9 fatty acid desaturase [Stachybotrys elegans]
MSRMAPAVDGTTDYVPMRRKTFTKLDKHISELPVTWNNWFKHVEWFNVIFALLIPLAGLIATIWVPLKMKTGSFALFCYVNNGLGITAGYHRLWSHRSYRASFPLRIYLAAFGAGSVQGSIRWWSKEHRVHHRYTDTNKDPYCINKGLLYSHIGWILMKKNPKEKGRSDVSDLDQDPVVVWQHRHYIKCAVFMGYILPISVCGLGWDDWAGGIIYAGILRVFFFQQATFCVNSLAHWLGEQPFDSKHSPRDHLITAIITLGEGYHNFHHEFPSDYRNAIKWYQYDPTKWAIAMWERLSLASHLQKFPHNEIEKGRVQQLEKKLDERRSSLDWGVPLSQLSAWEWQEYKEAAENGQQVIAVSGVVYDVARFADTHPGGKMLLHAWIGKDATAAFHGGIYDHSNAAHNLLSSMRLAVLRGGELLSTWTCLKFWAFDTWSLNDV